MALSMDQSDGGVVAVASLFGSGNRAGISSFVSGLIQVPFTW
jgi:hypothetical protein